MSELSKKPTVVIAGASGFVGSALGPRLKDRFRVVGLSRTARANAAFDEVRSCDLFSLLEAERALEGAQYAVYLVHSMMPSARLTQGRFDDLDLICADNFARAAARAGVQQIVYLGGLLPASGALSTHLASRAEVERVLASRGTPTTVLRAGLVLGSGGSSFEMLRRLVQRLPAMALPTWTRTPSQPVGLDDLCESLSHVLGRTEHFGGSYDVGTPRPATYEEVLRQTAELLGRRRFFVRVPLLSPGLSRLWVSLVTGAPRALVGPLVKSLRTPMVVDERRRLRIPGRELQDMRAALAAALEESAASTPHAFVGSRARRERDLVRSVQRMQLPAGWNAERAAHEYVNWLPRALGGFLSVMHRSDGAVEFRLAVLRLPLLVLSPAPARSTPDRQLFYLTGGALARMRPGGRPRFELRQVLDNHTLLTVVHDFEPRLPWWLYRCTQALFHAWVMSRFGRHLAASDPSSHRLE